MRIPKTPPPFSDLFATLANAPERVEAILLREVGLLVEGEYLHWDDILHRTPPAGMSHEDWWLAIKTHRMGLYREVPLTDKAGRPFEFLEADPIPERLHTIDLGAGGRIEGPDQVTNPETRDRYYVESLIQEAITSSQLEGATTTRQVAKEMIRTGRSPRDRSERMILNNFKTMQRIGKIKEERLSKELVFEIHRIITDRTLDEASAAGRFRREDERLYVGDTQDRIFHLPPPSDQLGDRMAAMCSFANGRTPDGFIHPVIRSVILHFWLGYDHPFVDGNGRTARALFYWSMLHHGYWLFEFISISQILLKAPAKYGRSFLHTETDGNDLTYFIFHQIDVIHRAIGELHAFIKRKSRQIEAIENRLKGGTTLNHRQRALLGHALRHPRHRYTIESHRVSHNVVYPTARSDLMDLRNRGLLDAVKVGRTWNFTPVKDLERRLTDA